MDGSYVSLNISGEMGSVSSLRLITIREFLLWNSFVFHKVLFLKTIKVHIYMVVNRIDRLAEMVSLNQNYPIGGPNE